MARTYWQWLGFAGTGHVAGHRPRVIAWAGEQGASTWWQHTSPNASGAMAMPQDLWHRTTGVAAGGGKLGVADGSKILRLAHLVRDKTLTSIVLCHRV